MISAGERSGRLPEVLVTIADCSEEDLETTVKRTTSLIEPALIVVLGLVVGLIALAMLLPVFGMSQVASV
jgi:type IV pilus assembly protein PilC